MENDSRGLGLRARGWAAALAVLAFPLLMAVPAAGHAVLLQASLDEANLKANTAATVILRFNSAIEAAFVKVFLLDASSKESELATRPGPGPDLLSVELPPLPAGAYALRYKILAADGHFSNTVVRFRIPGLP